MVGTSSLDGVETFLQPVESHGASQLRFCAIPANVEKHTSHYTESTIRKSGGVSFDILVKLPEHFRLPTHTAILIEVIMGDGLGSAGKSGVVRWDVPAAHTDASRFLLAGSGDYKNSGQSWQLTTNGLKFVKGAKYNNVSGVIVEPGDFAVVVFMCHSRWKDGSTSRYGSCGPLGFRSDQHLRGDPLDGEMGKNHTFVYRPVVRAVFERAAGSCPWTRPEVLASCSRGFIRNAEFYDSRPAHSQRFRELQAAWLLEQTEIRSKASTDQLTQSITIAQASQPQINYPLGTAPMPPSQSLTKSLEVVDVEPTNLANIRNTTRSAEILSNRTKARRPAVCTCPLEHRVFSRGLAINRVPTMAGAANLATKPKQPDVAKEVQSNDETREFNPFKAPSETVAIACSRCTQLRCAPRGKKIAFRKARGRYMYVAWDAPDDDDVEDLAGELHSQQVDEGDERPLLHQHNRTEKLADGLQDQPIALEALEAQLPEEVVVPQEVIIEPATALVEQGSGRSPGPEAGQVPATAVAQMSDVPPNNSQGSQSTTEASAIEKTVVSQATPTPSTTALDREVVFKKPDDESLIPTDTSATGPALAPQEQGVASNNASADRAENPLVGGPPVPTQRPIGTKSNKRPSTPYLEDRPGKQQRVDVDLTNDEDNDLIMVKAERLDSYDKNIRARLDKDSERAKLEARLNQVVLQQKQLQLQLEEAELRQKLKHLAQGNGHSASKQKSAVKVEIEID